MEDLIKKFPNDFDLGAHVRENKNLVDFDVNLYPNDQSLGRQVRTNFFENCTK